MSAFYCSTEGITGAGTFICDIKLTSKSTGSSVTVNLSSNDKAVTLPATVTIPANATTAAFNGSASSVLTTQMATLTAKVGSSSMNVAVQLNAATQTLSVSATNLVFGYQALKTPGIQQLVVTSTGSEPITIRAASISGAGFSLPGVSFPLTLKPWQRVTLNVQFDPSTAGPAAGRLTLTGNSTSNTTNVINLTGTGGPPALSAFYCSTGGIKGAGTFICDIKLTSKSTGSSVTVNLSSNDKAVTLPATVTIPAEATSVQFSANVESVAATQTALLTADLDGSSTSFSLQLNANTPILTASSASFSFQDVVVDTTVTKMVSLTSTGTSPVTISSAASTGSGFAMSGLALPLTLNPGQSAMLRIQFAPRSVGSAIGQVALTSNSMTGSTLAIGLSGTAVNGPGGNGTPQAPFTYTGSTLLKTFIPPGRSAPISADLFGMTIYNLAPDSYRPQPNMTPFPSFPVSVLRFWDVAYWGMLEPSEGQYVWVKMDNSIAIAQQNGVKDFIFTFGQIPTWAAENPTDPCTGGEGTGTCSVPTPQALQDFATHVVQRYCGIVKYYEPWNEPSNPAFWDGNNSQLLAVAQQVYQIAKDPANCGCTNGVCAPNGGVNPNQVLLPPISNLSQGGLNWLDSYLTAAGSSYPYADVIAFHDYGYYNPDDMVTGTPMQQFRQILGNHGLSNLEIWDTEASWEWDTRYTQDQQASWLMRFHMAQAELGISRAIWYMYDSCHWGTLWPSVGCTNTQTTDGQLTEAGQAYGTIENWLIGANLTQCQLYQNGLWACGLERSNGYNAWMLWSRTGSSISVRVPADLDLTVYRDWQNNVHNLPPQVTIDQMPVLLESSDLLSQ